MGIGAKVASLYAELTLDDAKFKRGIDNAANSVSSFGGRVQNAGQRITGFGAQLAVAAVPLGLIGKESLDAASSFEVAMAEISARTGLVGADMERISEFSLQMGADTAFSAQEAAQGFLELLSSGQDAEQALATLPIVLDLAAASGEDLGRTADVLTDIMAAFGLEVSSAADVSNALARAAAASSADVSSLGDGFANVGPVAAQFGVDVDTAAAALAILSENGVKGAEAGTALKSMLLNMTRDTDDVAGAWERLGTSFYDAEGNARPLEQVLADIKTGLEGMPLEEQNRLLADLAGNYGIVALTALLGDVSISDMKDSMNEQASAADIAAQRMDTFAGSADALGGSIETLQIRAFTPFMNETLRPLLDMTTQAINLFADWAADNPETTNTILSLGLALIGLSTAALILGPILTFLGGGLALIASPIALIAAAFAMGFARNWEDFAASLEDVRAAFEGGNIGEIISSIAGALYEVVDSIAQAPVAIAEFLVGADTIKAGFEGWATALESVKQIAIWIGENMAMTFASIDFEIPKPIRDLADMIGAIADNAGLAASLLGIGGAPAERKASEGWVGIGVGIDEPWTPPERAHGGPVSAGRPYIVGETGMELFVPSQSGVVIPNSALSGGTAQPIIVQLDSQVLFEATVREGQRRNVAVVG